MSLAKIITHKNKVPLVSGDNVAAWDRPFVDTIGYDNVDGNTTYCILFKHKFTSVTSSTVGIKIPILSNCGTIVDSYSLTNLNVWNNSTDSVPTWGYNNYLPLLPEPNFWQNDWSVTTDTSYINIYTSSSLAKSGLNTTDYFWFGILLRTDTGCNSTTWWRGTLETYNDLPVNCQFRPYNAYFSNIITKSAYVTILDY